MENKIIFLKLNFEINDNFDRLFVECKNNSIIKSNDNLQEGLIIIWNMFNCISLIVLIWHIIQVKLDI